MQLDKKMMNDIKNHFGYSDEELEIFLENPRNQDVLSKGVQIASKTIIAEVIESHGCNSQHKAGDKFYFDAGGNLLTKLCPKKICIYALSALDKLIFTVNELLYAGVDPNQIRFKRASCIDVGLQCGGWGKCVLEISVVDRETLKK